MLRFHGWLLAASFALSSCGPATVDSTPTAAPTSSGGAHFDPAACGTIEGRVHWTGAIPAVQPFTVFPAIVGLEAFLKKADRANPNAPHIDAQNRGVGDAVIFLRGVAAEKARPWDHAAVTVEMQDYRFAIRQGKAANRHGFVRRGDAVTMVSRQSAPHGVHADGAAFFSLPFPDPDRPLARRLERAGVVELSSSVPYFWMRAYLFVSDHPYFATTASDGSFRLAAVPAGSYELVCWLPNWREADHDLDPESGIVLRLWFRPPVEVVIPVTVRPGQAARLEVPVASERFDR